jgi:acetoin utilization deacetylase AcuC-like enzyme
VEAIRSALVAAEYWEPYPKVAPVAVEEEILTAIHSESYLHALPDLCKHSEMLDMDTYTTPSSWNLALQAAGGAVAVSTLIWRGEARRGFALTRPPGHHATFHRGMGFCLINNAAVAAQYLLTKENAQRIAIVDIDLHHGNGTQDIFWFRKDVFYISMHQSPLYPGTGDLNETGAGEGQGYTANLPLPPATGDAGFQVLTEEVILPLLDTYHPEMILVSYGFDAHWRDPLGYLRLSAMGYYQVIKKLTQWADAHCNGRILLVLEGGYDLDSAAACSVGVVSALLSEPFTDPLGPAPRPEGNSWRQVLERAKEIWEL